jgi:hypothetical protein
VKVLLPLGYRRPNTGKAKAPASLVNKGKQGPRYVAVTVGFELAQKRRRQSKIVEMALFSVSLDSYRLLAITMHCAQNALTETCFKGCCECCRRYSLQVLSNGDSNAGGTSVGKRQLT